jgi:hypothetical protein
MSSVLCLCSLASVLCPLSHVSVPYLPSSVPYLTYLFLVSRPLSPCPTALLLVSPPPPSYVSALSLLSPVPYISRICSLPTVRCPQSYASVPCIPSSIPVSRLCSLSPVLCSLPINCSSVHFLWLSIPLFLSYAPLFSILCSSISCPLSIVFHTCEKASFS